MNGAAVIQPAPIPFYTVLVLYLGIMAFIGWYAGRKTNNIGDFFVLSGKAGVVVSGIAYFSTQFSMGTFLGTPGTIYGVGYAGMAISVPGAVFCMILPALLIGRKLITLGHKYGFLTMADYLTDRYHSKNMSGVLGVMMLFFLVPMMGAQIIGAGVIVHVFTGLPEWVGVVGMGIIVILYCMTGGMKGAMMTDVIQGSLMIATAVVTFIVSIRGYNVLRRKAQGSRNPVIVFPHSLLLIASCKAQIHRRINPLTDSSKPGAEPVYKTRNFFKLRPGKISHSLIFSDIHMRHVFLMP